MISEGTHPVSDDLIDALRTKKWITGNELVFLVYGFDPRDLYFEHYRTRLNSLIKKNREKGVNVMCRRVDGTRQYQYSLGGR